MEVLIGSKINNKNSQTEESKSDNKEDAEDYASTKHKGKPEKVKQETKVRALIRKMVSELMDEGFAGGLKKEDRKAFDKMRRKQSEVLGYTLTGKDDIKTEIGDATVQEGKLKEGINVEKFVKAIEKGKDVVVYDKKGKRYNLQGGDKKSVQVTDHWEDTGRRNIHPERTWQTLPLSKVKKIVAEEKLSEMKVNKGKVDKTYKSVLNHMRKVVKKLNDDEMYEVTTQLKKWFNKNIY